MKIQIYTMQAVDEAPAVIALGVDHIGITPGEYGLPGEVSFAMARAIVEEVGDSAICVALSVDSDFEAICAMVTVVPELKVILHSRWSFVVYEQYAGSETAEVNLDLVFVRGG